MHSSVKYDLFLLGCQPGCQPGCQSHQTPRQLKPTSIWTLVDWQISKFLVNGAIWKNQVDELSNQSGSAHGFDQEKMEVRKTNHSSMAVCAFYWFYPPVSLSSSSRGRKGT